MKNPHPNGGALAAPRKALLRLGDPPVVLSRHRSADVLGRRIHPHLEPPVCDRHAEAVGSPRYLVRYQGGGGFTPEIITSAQGSFLYTESGRRLFNFTSGQMSSILGHSHPEIVATVSSQVASLDHLYSCMVSQPVDDLARRIAGTLPDPLEKVLLLTAGSESNEAALRMAKLVIGKHEIVSFSRSWRGMTQGSVAATYSSGRKGYGPAASGNFAIPTPDPYRPDSSLLVAISTGRNNWT